MAGRNCTLSSPVSKLVSDKGNVPKEGQFRIFAISHHIKEWLQPVDWSLKYGFCKNLLLLSSWTLFSTKLDLHQVPNLIFSQRVVSSYKIHTLVGKMSTSVWLMSFGQGVKCWNWCWMLNICYFYLLDLGLRFTIWGTFKVL